MAKTALSIALTAILAAGGGAVAGPRNFAPEARAAAVPVEALAGEPVRFSAAGSTDPDGGPEPLSYFWEFGDGETSALAEPVHAFREPGAKPVTLTVTDGVDTAVAVVTVFVLLPPAPGRPSKSGSLALSPAEDSLWVVNEDSGSVTVHSLEERDPWAVNCAEISVGLRPRAIAFSPDGDLAYVTLEGAGAVLAIDARRIEAASPVPVGHRPQGIATVSGDGRVVVALGGEALVAILEGRSLERRKLLAVDGSPRAIAISHDGRQALITHFVSRGAGKLTRIDLEREVVAGVTELPADLGPDTPSSGRGVPNLLAHVALEPSGAAAWVGGVKSNVSRGLYRDGQPLGALNRVRGLIAKVDLASGEEVLERRIDLNNADSGSAIDFFPTGRYAYVTHQGTGELSVYDLAAATLVRPGGGATVPFTARIPVGDAPQGIVVDRAGRRAYVLAYLSRAVTVLDLSAPAAPRVLGSIRSTDEPLLPRIANGKRLFFRSSAPVHSSSGYIACASCHPDGGAHDGQTWDFTDAGEGLRSTIDLRGRSGLGHGPVHWSANFDEIQDFEIDIVRGFGGTGLARDGAGPHPALGAPNAGRSEDLDDLALYVSSLTGVPESPHRGQDGALAGAALRGREVFFRGETGCAGCHAPPAYTDSRFGSGPDAFVFHDVGTIGPGSGGRLGARLAGLDTPTLKGVWATAPYLHDGSAPTLLDVLTARNPEAQHGRTSQLTTAEIGDLVAFLLALDERPAGGPADVFRRGDANCDGGVDGSDAVFTLGWLFLGDPGSCCAAAADANADRRVDISDSLSTLTWLFLGGQPPPAPGPFACGVVEASGPRLPCEAYPQDQCGAFPR